MRREVVCHVGGVPVHLWGPRAGHVDYCTDAAFVCARVFGGDAREWAERLVRAMEVG